MNYEIKPSNYDGAVEIWKNGERIAIVTGNRRVSAEQAAKNRIEALKYPYGC